MVETVVDQAARRVPVIAQTGATSTAEAIRLSRHAQSAGADVIMPVAPYYEPLSVEETLTYLRAVAGSVDIPVMLYNLPVATGVDLHPDTVGALAREVENIRYIKNTTIDMAQSAAADPQLRRRHRRPSSAGTACSSRPWPRAQRASWRARRTSCRASSWPSTTR